MSAKSILEADGKAILNYHLTRAPVIKPTPLPTPTKHNPPPRLCSLHFPEDANVEDVLNQAEVTYPWVLQPGTKFVAKPDQLIKRRGKSGLLALNKTWAEARAWIAERAGKEVKVETTTGVLRQFLVEPFVPHPQDTEYYINIMSVRDVSCRKFLELSSWSSPAHGGSSFSNSLAGQMGGSPSMSPNFIWQPWKEFARFMAFPINGSNKWIPATGLPFPVIFLPSRTNGCHETRPVARPPMPFAEVPYAHGNHCASSQSNLRNVDANRGDWILFTHEGGVDVGDVDAKAEKLLIPVDLSQYPSNDEIAATLLKKVPKGVHNVLVDFISRLYAVYVECQFTYLEINPLVVIPNEDATSASVHFLDLAAKLDQTADFECGVKWAIARSPAALGLTNVAASNGEKVNIDAGPPMEFPAPFGRELTKEEAYIADLDAKTGASLKLTVLNPNGRIWTLVAGGGASVVYADAIASSGFADELANYGEYSGAPTESQTYHYARTVLDLMLRAPLSEQGKVLFIGGGIANFTNVASTFKGVIRALRDYAKQLNEHNVQIWVRRAGPNYQEGLKNMKAATQELGLNAKIFGPEMHVSGIVPLALVPGRWEASGAEEFRG
ncbi:ATP citrate lyase [Colletotrichum incanum]|nr:ATP citrate lyase [Colletotrichum incanum]